ncbi:hypothetical protein AQUCO_00400198v1 [Aquilegia coerulea]|uniref:AAA+ ATPase domain-containing protein n=1 Tax=Aquilegia coerulea TaxID=218851 RepID=A0A2G5ETT5_AQUCA|nr:hypothetical protein AQUCO_00400198v1 [Aquilegia coerulea]
MAESVVSFLLEKLVAMAKQEVDMLKGVRTDIEQMKLEFRTIKALLRDADAKVDIDQGVKDWVEQVRDIAYEIEDVLDEFFLSHHKKHADDPDHAAGRHGTTPIRSIKGIFQRIADFFHCLKVGHEIGSQIKDIKARTQEISSCRDRYNLRNLVEQGSTSSKMKSTTKHDPRENALFLEEFQLVGIDGAKEKLVGYLLEADTRLGVVSVFGEGGLGKTTIVKKVFDSPQVKEHFPYRAWITVSQTFKATALLRDLTKQLFPEFQAVDTMEPMKLKQALNANLRRKRYVVVLDDIWSLNAWTSLKNSFPNDEESASRIIVTTRSKNIAETCLEDYGHSYPLQPLDLEDSWKLFYKKAFKTNVENMNFCTEQVLRNLSMKFLKKCNGLPLAIVAIGGLLSMKQTSEWDQVYKNLGSLMDSSSGDQSHLADLRWVISLSYNDLPYYLKACFLYLCIFPEDYSISSSKLLRLWVAEGFVERKAVGMGFTMEEIARFYLDELIQRNLVQVEYMDERKRVKKCRIHDLMREFIIGKARDQNLATVIAEKQEELHFLSSDPSIGRRPPRLMSISCLRHEDTGANILSKDNTSGFHLRSLFLFMPYTGSWLARSSSTAIFSSFRLLRVLDLQDAGLEEFPGQIVSLLYLRYLSLRRNARITSLPNLVGDLVYLETLDLEYTKLRELPVGILKLRRLRHLLIEKFYTHYPGVKLPVGIDNFINLEKLAVVDADTEKSGLLVEELGKLTQLRKLAICNLKKEDGMQLFTSVQNMKYLRSLKVSSKSQNFLHSNSLSSPPEYLKCLCMAGILHELPSWIPSLQNLEELQLSGSELRKDPIKVLQSLPNLVTLTLGNWAICCEELTFSKAGFPRLKKLNLGDLGSLSKIIAEEGAMPIIKWIRFFFCEKLKEVPLGLEHLTTLEEVEHEDMHNDFVEQLEKHCWKAGHLPQILRT